MPHAMWQQMLGVAARLGSEARRHRGAELPTYLLTHFLTF